MNNEKNVLERIDQLISGFQSMEDNDSSGERIDLLKIAIQQLNVLRTDYDYKVRGDDEGKMEPLLTIFKAIRPLVKMGDIYAAKIAVIAVDILDEMDLLSFCDQETYKDIVGSVVRCATDTLADSIKAGVRMPLIFRAYKILVSLVVASTAGAKEWCLEEGEYFDDSVCRCSNLLRIEFAHKALFDLVDEQMSRCLSARGIDADMVDERKIPDHIIEILPKNSETLNAFLTLFYCRRILEEIEQEKELDEKIRKRASRRELWEEHAAGVQDDEMFSRLEYEGDRDGIRKLLLAMVAM